MILRVWTFFTAHGTPRWGAETQKEPPVNTGMVWSGRNESWFSKHNQEHTHWDDMKIKHIPYRIHVYNYDIFTYIWLICMVNAGKYTIHEFYGIQFSPWTYKASVWIIQVPWNKPKEWHESTLQEEQIVCETGSVVGATVSSNLIRWAWSIRCKHSWSAIWRFYAYDFQLMFLSLQT